jgi:RNA polymerase sigma factor (TIGR02999 family)
MAGSRPQQAVTSLLAGAEKGDDVWDRLLPLVYDELTSLARSQLSREAHVRTMNTATLVHESFMRLVDSSSVTSRGRAYFFAAAARAMRQVLVDRARRRRRLKRAGVSVTFESEHGAIDAFAADLLDLESALERLAALYPRQARVVDCRFFGGLSTEETAEALEVAPRTVKRDWALARAWLYRELCDQTGAPP